MKRPAAAPAAAEEVVDVAREASGGGAQAGKAADTGDKHPKPMRKAKAKAAPMKKVTDKGKPFMKAMKTVCIIRRPDPRRPNAAQFSHND